jgi:hypothetical protein
MCVQFFLHFGYGGFFLCMGIIRKFRESVQKKDYKVGGDRQLTLKGQCHEIFDFWFFHESVSPKHLSMPLRPFRIFSKIRGDIRGSRCTAGVNNRWQMEKIFKQKNFNNFVWAPLDSRVNIYIHFCLQVHFKVSAA